jgi:hypothetical protein
MSDEEPRQPIGPLLDTLGVTADLDPDQQITEALVLAKVTDFSTGQTALGVYHSGLDWVAQLGLIEGGRMVLSAAPFVYDDDD